MEAPLNVFDPAGRVPVDHHFESPEKAVDFLQLCFWAMNMDTAIEKALEAGADIQTVSLLMKLGIEYFLEQREVKRVVLLWAFKQVLASTGTVYDPECETEPCPSFDETYIDLSEIAGRWLYERYQAGHL